MVEKLFYTNETMRNEHSHMYIQWLQHCYSHDLYFLQEKELQKKIRELEGEFEVSYSSLLSTTSVIMDTY